jgi:hypothetical protein
MRKEKHIIGDTVQFVGKEREKREDGLIYLTGNKHPYFGQKCKVVETYQQLQFNKEIGSYRSWGEPGYKVVFEDGHTLYEIENDLHKVRSKK